VKNLTSSSVLQASYTASILLIYHQQTPADTTKKAVEEFGTLCDFSDEVCICYIGTRLKMAFGY